MFTQDPKPKLGVRRLSRVGPTFMNHPMLKSIPAIQLAFYLFLPVAMQAVHGAERPNILWLIAEDLGPAMSCYGNKAVHTPNLDRLASEGVRYTRAYTTAPVCSASRSAFMTGMYQTTIGAHNHRSHRGDGYALPGGVKPIPCWLQTAGYFTANLTELPSSFGFKGSGKTDWNFTFEGTAFESAKWDDLQKRQPFLAQINFHETHRPFHSNGKIDPQKITLPPYYPDHPTTRADMAAYLDDVLELDRKVGIVLEELKLSGLAENTLVLFMGDHGEAHVRGKQFCYEEGLHIPLIVRWPKNFTAPKQISPGKVDSQLIEAIDIAPTLLELAGMAKPAKMQGRNFLGDHAEPPRTCVFGARDRCDETVFRIRTVRDARYRYIHNFTPERPFLQPNAYKERAYPVWNLLKELHAQGKLTPEQEALCQPNMPAEELYDLDADPHEVRNLVESKTQEHQEALTRMRALLNSWIKDTLDQGDVFESEDVIASQIKPVRKAK